MNNIIAELKALQTNKTGRGLSYSVKPNNCHDERPESELEHEWQEWQRIHNVERY